MTGPLPGFLAPLTVPASWIYRGAVDLRNRRYDRRGPTGSVDRPVISVGNVTAGGVGKTPMVAWIADRLREHGRHPAVAMRGYRARPGEPGDEEAEYARRLPGVPVVADADRLRALRAFLPDHPEIDCVLLDDGFQHRQLRRDLDLVLVDAEASRTAQRLLPHGYLREPLESLSRADAVIVTHAQHVDADLESLIERLHGNPAIAWSRHRWSGLRRFDTANPADQDEGTPIPVKWLAGKRVMTLLGVGKPASIVAMLEDHQATVAVNVAAHDHERYDKPKVLAARGLCDGLDGLVTTAKDWVKLSRLIDLSKWPIPIVVPVLELDVFHGAEALTDLVCAMTNQSP